MCSCDTTVDSTLSFTGLYTERMVCPVGLENTDPGFTWMLESGEESRTQSAYHILVASDPGLLSEPKADIWNSGRVKSDQSVDLRMQGKELETSRRYFWKVKIWDQDGRSAGWSEVQYFEMGLREEADWMGAKWIGLEKDTRKSPHRFREFQTGRMPQAKEVSSFPTGYFRKEIKLEKKLEKAVAYFCGLGYYEMYCNGEKVSDHVLDPAATSYDHHALYVVHDLSDLLKKNGNTLGVILGNGFYGQNLAFNAPFLLYGEPAFKLRIHLEYADGTSAEIISDESWKASCGPIVFDNVYGGETYDARYELGAWTETDYDDSGWQDANVEQPEVGELRAQLLPPIRKIMELEPVEIFRGANGNWIVDFGQNISGWVRLKGIRESEGTIIRISSVEALTRKGDAIHPGSLGKTATGFNQDEYYICKGNGNEDWEPRFTYNSFRFAEISGMSAKPGVENLRAVVVYTDLEETGVFSCSDPLLEEMEEVSKWTVLDNMHGFPEDCPAREKCGWLGDAHATAQFNLYSFNMVGLYRKYAQDMESQLMEARGGDGQSFMVPTMVAPGKRSIGPATLDWGVAQIYIPWYLYLHEGDRRPLDDHYEEMKELVRYYLSFMNDKGIIENGLGDWCPPRWDRRDNPSAMECHPFISANAYFYDILGIMSRIAALSGEGSYSDKLDDLQNKLKEAFNREFLEASSNDSHWYGSQTATVMALRFGMVPGELQEDVIRGLVHDIKIRHKGHHSTGIHGNRHLYTVLCDLGMDGLSMDVLTHPEFPSQAFIVNSGHTTWPERQFDWTDGREWDRSLNHPMQAGFAAHFHEALAGIRPDPDQPGFKHFFIKPAGFTRLKHAGATIMSPYGEISSRWSKLEESVELRITVPFNTTATVVLPGREDQKLQAGSHTILFTEP